LGRQPSTKSSESLFDFEQFEFGCFAIFTCSWDFVSACRFLPLLGPTKKHYAKANQLIINTLNKTQAIVMLGVGNKNKCQQA
jgi:hypothetical protein